MTKRERKIENLIKAIREPRPVPYSEDDLIAWDTRRVEAALVLADLLTLEEKPTWHFQEKEWPSMNDPKASLCDVPGGNCTRQVENVNCEACLRLLNQHIQEKFR